jgi:hypothetical protein
MMREKDAKGVRRMSGGELAGQKRVNAVEVDAAGATGNGGISHEKPETRESIASDFVCFVG